MRFDVCNHALKRRDLLLISGQNTGLIRAASISHGRKRLLRLDQITVNAHTNKLSRDIEVSGQPSVRLQ
jgi:hypothetical protein